MLFQIEKSKSNNKYEGSVQLTEQQMVELSKGKTFKSKFELFCFGIEQNWTRKMIMKYCLDTTRDQYFYNYLIKYRSNQNK
jgi:hypothetical protein